ncbi:MAG: transcriptional repressor [Bacteroidales bacterium]|jgi:Fur family peroxide stress response transcriptional regulator|nr:transcriptional repressor [Bacteroidales bacterium]
MNKVDLHNVLRNRGLKITPQRTIVFDAVVSLGNHPTTDKIIEHIKQNHPHIAVGTVYKILDTFVEHGILKRVKTDKDVMRYDHDLDKHHHLYSSDSDRIEDYYDEDLNNLLEQYFQNKKIKNFTIEDIKLQIIGKFYN